MMRARIPRTTFGLVAVVAVALVMTTLVIGIVADWFTHEAIERQLDHRIEAETSALLAEAREGGLDRLAAAIRLREAARTTASLDYLLLDAAGEHLAGAIVADAPLKPGYEEFFYYRRGDHAGVAQALTTPVGDATLVVAADRGELHSIDRTLMALFGSALAAMLAVGIGSAIWVGWTTRQRLARIDATAWGIIGGDLSRRIPLDGTQSEFDHLAQTLNEMLDRIGGLMDNLRQVSSDVAHDLRTPLTRLYNSLDRALVAGDASIQREEIERAKAQAADLLDIFAALLRIAEIEGMTDRLPRQPVDLSLLLEQMAESYRPDMEEDGRDFRCVIEPGIVVAGDRRLLSQAIANLLDNTLRHTSKGTHVTMSAARSEAGIRVVVADDGQGVEPAEAKRLFQRFARSEGSRSTPGHGLGLALVAAVMTAHGGEAHLGDGKGFRVILSLDSLA